MSDEQGLYSTRWSVIAQLHEDHPSASWDWFIRRYSGYVAAVLRHVGLRADDVAAATDEFWSYLYSSHAVQRADRSGRFRAFLSGVVRNYMRTWRRQQERGRSPSALEPELLPDLEADVDMDLWAAQILHLGLARLGREHPSDERALRAFYGLPDEVGGDARPRQRATEIARQLGQAPNAMHQQLFRARAPACVYRTGGREHGRLLVRSARRARDAARRRRARSARHGRVGGPAVTEQPNSGGVLPSLPDDVHDELLDILFGDPRARDERLLRLEARAAEHRDAIAAHVSWHRAARGRGAAQRATHGRDPAAAVRAVPSLEPGEAFGDYVVERLLGQGGMGDVYLARQVSLGRLVALKLIRGDHAADAAARERFRREARAVARLRHPGICAVYEVGEVGDVPFLAMQYVAGETLAARLAAKRNRQDAQPTTAESVRAVLQMFCKIAEALHAAHEAGIVHRDVKPGNIVLDERDEPVLLDFGLARDVDRPIDDLTLTLSGAAIGTPPYMSPEQVRPRGPVDRRTDVYSLAVTLFECLTAERPFQASDPLTLCEQIERDPTPDPRTRNRHLPVDLTAVLGKAMEKAPARRYATARELAEDLGRVCRSEPVRARRIGASGRLWRWARRYPLAAALYVVLLSGGLVVAVFLQLTLRQRDDLAQVSARLAERQEAYDLLSNVVHLENARTVVAGLFPVSDLDEARARFDAVVAPLRRASTEIARSLERLRADALEWTESEQRADAASHAKHDALLQLRAEVEEFRRAQALRTGDSGERARALPFDAGKATVAELAAHVRARVGPQATVTGEADQGFAAAEVAFARLLAGEDVGNPVGVVMLMVFAANDMAVYAEANALMHCLINAQDAEVRTGAPKHVDAAFLQSLSDELDRIRRGSAAELERLEGRLAELEGEVHSRRTWRMRRPEDGFLHSRLSALAPELDAFLGDEVPLAESRLAWSAREHELTVARYADRWAAARSALMHPDGVLASAAYGAGIDLAPQSGLVPIGKNPVTGLWEFYHLRSAWDPRGSRDPATLPIPEHDEAGRIRVLGDTGIVFVLVPAGTAVLGSQDDDPAEPHFDPQSQEREEHPVNAVQLDAFFLARHELTEGQWARLTGQPSEPAAPFGLPAAFGYAPDAWLPPRYEIANHPTFGETWRTYEAGLRAGALQLPTSAQWEYACRAGTGTVWPTGDAVETLRGHANLLDLRSTGRQLARGAEVECAMFDDGFKALAPVGVLRANRWGFHDMIGNVAEWCADDCAFYSVVRARPGDGWRVMREEGDPWRDVRGGSYKDPPRAARSAARLAVEADASSLLHGVRVARRLQ